jgi:hypothetical protein
MLFDVVCCASSNCFYCRRMAIGKSNLKTIERKEMSLIATIEELDPGHFSRRKDSLNDLREKVRALGFFPLHLSQSDIDCYWIRLELKENAGVNVIHFTRDDYEDITYNVGTYGYHVLDIFKGVAKYDGTI